MIRFKKLLFIGFVLIGITSIGIASVRNDFSLNEFDPIELWAYQDADTTAVSEPEPGLPDGALRYPIKDKSNNPNNEKFEQGGLDLDDPDNIEYKSEYDPVTNQVTLYRRVGGVDMRLPYTMSLQEYMNNDMRKSMGKYYRDKIQNDAGNSTPGTGNNWLGSAWKVGGDGFESVFGSNAISIKSQGSAEIIIGVKHTKIDNPALQEDLRKTTTFDFDQKIQVNVQASIGDKLKMGINYNTEASFDFENQTKLEYAGKEDDIIRKIEFGNVTMPLPGSLITGSQSLFGAKAELQFGKLNLVTLFSQQKGQTKVLNIEGGAQQQEFEVTASAYDKNRHFFLALAFRDQFEASLKNLPTVETPIRITDLEVWVTNKSGNYENSRNIIAFTDLGETTFSSNNLWTTNPDTLNPSNSTNTLYQNMNSGPYKEARDITKTSEVFKNSTLVNNKFSQVKDYEKIENARKLAPTEYKYNEELGYISLNTALNNDEVLAVYYSYTNKEGNIYTVGDKATSGIEGSKALYLKLLKGTNLSPEYKTPWKLMMKNIYSLGAFQVSNQDFRLDITLLNDTAGGYINYIPEGGADVSKKRFLALMGFDKLNQQGEPQEGGDGMFDYLEGYTINSSNGRVVFPVLEPFGSHLESVINDTLISNKYVYQEIYDNTITDSKEQANKDKFRLKGKYKSSGGSDISLNAMDIPEGGVTITAGGIVLKENVDYTVDYALGRVKIINKGLLESGTPIQISLESRALFNLQTKTMMGMHADYKFNDKFNLGATVMNLREQPLTTKVNIGTEPINNTIWGLNGTYVTDSKALTNFLNKAPFWNLKETSSLSFDAEFAHLIPGHNKAIGKEGTSYIDDFEAAASSIDLRSWTAWSLASTPQGQSSPFPEGEASVYTKDFNKNRARLAWYVIDPLFYNNSGVRPGYMNDETISDDRIRQVQVNELYPFKNTAYGQPTNVAVLNLAYYPAERGQYNYDTNSIDPTGNFTNPEERWGGIMRSIETNDFEAANIEYIEFWMMDPSFGDPTYNGGDLYINLGNLSEDVLRDGRKSFEHGLPVPGVVSTTDTTTWGRVPNQQSLTNAFNADPLSRFQQDVGLDGYNSADENSFFTTFLNSLTGEAQAKAKSDPSSDDYHYFRGSDYDQQQASILDRYKRYNNAEGNSVPSEYSPESYATASTSIPDQEDVNKDNTLSETESYFQYRVSLADSALEVGKNFITDKLVSDVKLPNGATSKAVWYQFRVPVNDPSRVSVENMKDLRSVRFMRMYLKNCTDTTILRFGSLDLVRGDWRKYTQKLGDDKVMDYSSPFDLSAVNIEENGGRTPINYVLPPGVDRVQNPSNPQVQLLNEQSLVMRVNDLVEGDAKGAYKSLQMDIRQYKNLKMFIHAEDKDQTNPTPENELVAFIRIGSDFSNNYYEYEVPLKMTPWGEKNAAEIWPASNEINLKLENLEVIKLARNDLKRAGQGGGDYTKRFVRPDPANEKNQIVILGNPSISNIRSIMIGVRNRRSSSSFKNISAEIWFNELRLTDFDEEGGWAANARATLKLAEFGTIALAGATSSIGFGSLDKSVTERSQSDNYQYDFASTLELGKVLGPESRMSIPFYSSTSSAISNPKYYPVDPDIELKTALNQADTKAEKEEIKSVSQDLTTRKSINFTNVKLMPKQEQVPVYDVSNLAATYSYNETYKQNVSTAFMQDENYRGVIGYNYNARPKAFEPFVKSSSLNKPAFKLIRDFNLYPYPNQISYSWEMLRNYREEKFRNLSEPNDNIPIIVKKDFYWNKFFDLKYAITKNLKFDFRSINNARIDEPIGVVNSNDDNYSTWKDSVTTNVLHGGRTTMYQHNFNFNYTIPINKLPYLDWTSASLRYGGMYSWSASPLTTSTIVMGNTIRNSNTIQLTGQLNLTTLYNKSNYIKSLWKKYDFDAPKKGKGNEGSSARFNKNGLTFTKGTPITINHKLKTEEVTLKAFDKSGKPIAGKTESKGSNSVTFTPDADAEDGRVMVTGVSNDNGSVLQTALDVSTLILTSVKNISANYSENNGSMLPGYLPYSGGILGTSNSANNLSDGAPGLPFILGWQDDAFAQKASEKGYTTTDAGFNTPYTMVKSQDFSIKSNIEPFRGFKIELLSDRRQTYSLSEKYINDPSNGYSTNTRRETGTFSMSFIALGTFNKVETTGAMESEGYNQLLANRSTISHRLAGTSPSTSDTSIYAPGYGALQQDVLVSSFISAYSGISPDKIYLSAIPSFAAMMPNWRVSYDGIGKISGVKKVAKSVDLLHTYRCTYNVGSYVSSQTDKIFDDAGNVISSNQIGAVSINEQFSPLIMVNVTWMNDLTTRAEFKKGRTVSLNITNSQLVENYNNEMIFGVGYRFDKLGIIMNNKKLTNDINLRVDFSIRENQAIIRKIQEQVNQLTAGMRISAFVFTADYALNSRYNLQAFFRRNVNTPFISLSFPTTDTSYGISFRMSLAQ